MIYAIIPICLLVIYIIVNLYIKLRRAEKLIVKTEFDMQQRFIEFYVEFKKAHNRMEAVDRKQIFKTDDEVGFTFKIIKDIVTAMDEDFKVIIQNG